jgi:superfamily II DNA or RNA helicase
MMELRPHQQLAIDQIRHSLATGHRRPLLAAPCSFGKTLTAAYILQHAAEKGNRVIFFADRIKLISQTCDQFDKLGLKYGVIQGQHEMTDPSQLIQIASVQTIARRQKMPEFSLAIVDECHIQSEVVKKLMERYDLVPIIGLSATPYSKGLGRYYDDLLVPITAQELLEKGYLAPVHYYGGSHIDMSKIKMKAISTGGSDYDPDQLAEATEQQQEKLTGDIVRNWLLHGEDSQTIAFSPSIRHSQYLVDMFKKAGISAVHIDGYMDERLRQVIYKKHNEGEFKILSCSKLLNTGYDAPSVRCLIDCYPTKSIISYQQRAGRIMRINPGKEYAIYLDHASNCQRFGFAESIVPSVLDDGEKKFLERDQVKETKEKKQHTCPQCSKIMLGIRCSCGYEFPIKERLETDSSTLVQLASAKAYAQADKSMWYSGLLTHARNKGYSDGWAAHKYKSKYGVWPRSLDYIKVGQIPMEDSNWILSENIRYGHRNNKWKKAG